MAKIDPNRNTVSIEYHNPASDINRKSPVLLNLTQFMKPYAMLARWDRPVGAHLLFIPCLLGLLIRPEVAQYPIEAIKYALLFMFGAITMRGAGCTINDLWDRHIDAKVERTSDRPLANGDITPNQARIFLLLQLLFGALILFQFPLRVVIIGLASLPLVALYPLSKRYIWWPQAVLGITFNWGVLVGAGAMSAAWWGLSTELLYTGLLIWTIGYDTIYAYQDISDDVQVNIKSTARLFGKHGKVALVLLYTATAVLLSFAFLAAPHISQGAAIATFLVTTLFMIRIIAKFDMTAPKNALYFFKQNILYGYLIVIIGLVDILLQQI